VVDKLIVAIYRSAYQRFGFHKEEESMAKKSVSTERRSKQRETSKNGAIRKPDDIFREFREDRELLAELAEKLPATSSSEEVLDLVFDCVMSHQGWPYASEWRLDEESEKLCFVRDVGTATAGFEKATHATEYGHGVVSDVPLPIRHPFRPPTL